MYYKKVFLLFSKKEGCQHIAQEFALKGIEKIVNNKCVNSIFEFGIGIGTIPYLLNSLNKKLDYFGTEENEFCINAFQENLKDIDSKFNFNHIKSFSNYNEDFKFDFIIIDGSFDNEIFLRKIVKLNTIILVEGDRKLQREFLTRIFPNALVSHNISICKNEKDSPFYSEKNNSFIGGYTLFRLYPSIMNKMEWFSEKVFTFFKYKIRKFL